MNRDRSVHHESQAARKTIAIIGGIAAIVLGLWLTRVTLVEWVAARVVDGMGLGPCTIEIAALGLSQATLRVAASAAGTIERVDLYYGLDAGWRPRVEGVRIAGARLRFAWQDGSLLPAIAATGGASGPPQTRVEIVDSNVALQTGSGVVVVDLSGTLAPGTARAADIAFAVRAPAGHVRGTISGTLTQDGLAAGAVTVNDGDFALGAVTADHLTGTVALTARGNQLERLTAAFGFEHLASGTRQWGGGQLTAALDQPQSTLAVALQSAPVRVTLTSTDTRLQPGASLAIDADVDSGFLGLLTGRFSATAGNMRLQIAVTVPPVQSLAAALSLTVSEWLGRGRAEGNLSAAATTLVVADTISVATATAALQVGLANGALTGILSDEISMTGVELAARLASADSAFAHVARLVLAPADTAPLFSIAFKESAGTLQAAAKVTLTGPRFALRGPVDATATFDASPRSARAVRPSAAGRFSVHGALVLERPSDPAPTPVALAFDGNYTVDPATRQLTAAAIEHGSIGMPAQGLAADGVSASYTRADGNFGRLTIAELRSTATPALFVPLRAELELRVVANEARFSATVHDSSRRISATLAGVHQRDSGQGHATVIVKPIDLGGTGTLAQLSPALAAKMIAASGTIAVGGSINWGDRALPGALSLTVKDVVLRAASMQAAEVNVVIALDSLTPLHSASGQRFSGMFDFPGVKHVPLTLAFRLEPAALILEHGRAEIFGGTLATTDATIDVATGASHIDLQVNDVDLEAALMVLNLDSLKGSGRVSGQLPLRFAGGRLAIDHGHLQAALPGTLQIGVETLADQLKSYGENVDLAFRALTDFHYQQLVIDADKALLGAGTAKFRLQGNNPAVMAGQPFIFNISLETDFDYLATLLLKLSGATNTALTWGTRAAIRR